MGLTAITEKNFRKKLKGCGIKNYPLIPKKELKERLGFCSTRKQQRKVEISDDYFFLSARAGGILQILRSDWFRERAVFSHPARSQRAVSDA